MPPEERPGYRKYSSVDLPAQSKARELTRLSSSRRVARPSFALEKAFGKSRPGNNISHIHGNHRQHPGNFYRPFARGSLDIQHRSRKRYHHPSIAFACVLVNVAPFFIRIYIPDVIERDIYRSKLFPFPPFVTIIRYYKSKP